MQKLTPLWTLTPWSEAVMVVLSCSLGFVLILVLTRLFGLRTLAKMSSFDFVTTVALGSILAATVLTRDPPLANAATALATLYLLVHLMAWARHRWPAISALIDNEPILLMEGSNILDRNLAKVRVSHSELRAKLREANVTHLSQVKAVVMETTGDISVLSGPPDAPPPDPALLEGVRRS